jgi:hypothetical protein
VTEYRPEIHGKVLLNVQYQAECPSCGWHITIDKVSVGDVLPPDALPCPRCLLTEKWQMVRVVRT